MNIYKVTDRDNNEYYIVAKELVVAVSFAKATITKPIIKIEFFSKAQHVETPA